MSKTNNWYVYIVRCSDNSLYTGVTTDLERRLHEHNHSPRGARYTRNRRPVKLVYAETTETRSSACKREYTVKQLTAEQKHQLLLNSPVGVVDKTGLTERKL